MTLEGAGATNSTQALHPLPTKSHYFIGRDRSEWITDVPTFRQVRQSGVYPGVDLLFYGSQGRLEFDFQLAPGADPALIALRFVGIEEILPQGEDLQLRTNSGSRLLLRKPTTFQQQGSLRTPVASSYQIRSDGRVGVEVGTHDRSKSLIIDPILDYATPLGAGDRDKGVDIAIDSDHNVYVLGETNSDNFPTTPEAFRTDIGKGEINAFLTKFTASGDELVFSTIFGDTTSSFSTIVAALALDSERNIYVVGSSSSPDLPRTPGAYDSNCGASGECQSPDGFVAKFSPAGDELIYVTYLGGE